MRARSASIAAGLKGKPVEEIDADPKAKAGDRGPDGRDLRRPTAGQAILAHMQNFFDCIASGKQPVANVCDHVRAVNACHWRTSHWS